MSRDQNVGLSLLFVVSLGFVSSFNIIMITRLTARCLGHGPWVWCVQYTSSAYSTPTMLLIRWLASLYGQSGRSQPVSLSWGYLRFLGSPKLYQYLMPYHRSSAHCRAAADRMAHQGQRNGRWCTSRSLDSVAACLRLRANWIRTICCRQATLMILEAGATMFGSQRWYMYV